MKSGYWPLRDDRGRAARFSDKRNWFRLRCKLRLCSIELHSILVGCSKRNGKAEHEYWGCCKTCGALRVDLSACTPMDKRLLSMSRDHREVVVRIRDRWRVWRAS